VVQLNSNFFTHLVELKQRLLQLIISYVILFIICYYWRIEIYQILLTPLIKVVGKPHLIYTNLTEAFFTYLNLAASASFILIIPFLAFHIYRFIAPGLYKPERRLARLILIGGPFLFFTGLIFVYFLVMPKAWEFFLSFQAQTAQYNLSLEAKVSEYISLVISLIMAFGIAFQLPIFMLILIILKLITVANLKNKRRLAIVIIFIIAGIITPPDVFSQLALAFPMVLLYEITILIGSNIEGRRQHA